MCLTLKNVVKINIYLVTAIYPLCIERNRCIRYFWYRVRWFSTYSIFGASGFGQTKNWTTSVHSEPIWKISLGPLMFFDKTIWWRERGEIPTKRSRVKYFIDKDKREQCQPVVDTNEGGDGIIFVLPWRFIRYSLFFSKDSLTF